jgi:hypothetical protein
MLRKMQKVSVIGAEGGRQEDMEDVILEPWEPCKVLKQERHGLHVSERQQGGWMRKD